MSTHALHDQPDLDHLYDVWMEAERKEQAALIMLGFRDDTEMHATYELMVERVQATKAAYEAARARLADNSAARSLSA